MLQHLLDGLLVGSTLALGAIGLTLVMHILRFANFAHAELLSIGAYAALVFDALFTALLPIFANAFTPLTVTGALGCATVAAMLITGLSAWALDVLVFRRLRMRSGALTMVFASFGVALILRNVIGLVFGLGTRRYSDEIAFAKMLSADPLLLVRPDQILVFACACVAMLAVHQLLTRTSFGFALRAVAENPTLASANGVDVPRMIVATWLFGGALAAVAGVLYALDAQMSPVMGRDLVLSLFAATIVGGIGSVLGAVAGGLIVGISSSVALVVVPAGYKPAVPFALLLLVLYLRPAGLFGRARA